MLLIVSRIARLLLLALTFSVPWRVLAQTTPTLAELTIELWPEYDQPAVLVIYRGQLAPDTPLPAQLTLQLPPDVAAPNALAYLDPDTDGLLNLDYSTSTAASGTLVTFEAPVQAFQLEYYDFSLDLTRAERSFVYTWPGDYAVQSLRFQVQQPVGASNLSLSPAATSTTLGGDTFTYHLSDVGSAAAGGSIALSVAYTKPDDTLSIDSLADQAVEVQPLDAPFVAETAAGPNPAVLALLIIGGVLLLGGGFLYWQFRDSMPVRRRPANRARRPRSRRAPRPAPTSAALFCHQCGHESHPDDHFCRQCGAELRRD